MGDGSLPLLDCYYSCTEPRAASYLGLSIAKIACPEAEVVAKELERSSRVLGPSSLGRVCRGR
jgi:hypothetical protein